MNVGASGEGGHNLSSCTYSGFIFGHKEQGEGGALRHACAYSSGGDREPWLGVGGGPCVLGCACLGHSLCHSELRAKSGTAGHPV